MTIFTFSYGFFGKKKKIFTEEGIEGVFADRDSENEYS